MVFHRIMHALLRFVSCGSQVVELVDDDKWVELAYDVEDDIGSFMTETDASAVYTESEEECAVPMKRAESLELRFQSVMHRALTFAHKWSDPNLQNRLRSSREELICESESDYDDSVEIVDRDSSQARFENLMKRTSLFVHRCTMYQSCPGMLIQ